MTSAAGFLSEFAIIPTGWLPVNINLASEPAVVFVWV